jgi:translation initiation factor 2-alpha kinase 4
MSRLGEGGFGITFKVRNNVDNALYALKTVRLSPNTTVEQRANVLREVDALSSLNCENVVRYYAAWVEGANVNDLEAHVSPAGSSGASAEASRDESYERMKSQFEGLEAARNMNNQSTNDDSTFGSNTGTSTTSTSADVQCICNLCSSVYKDWEVSFSQWGLLSSVLQPLNLCIECYRQSLPAESRNEALLNIKEKEKVCDYLFILMEYCEHTLLDEVERLANNAPAIWQLFSQCAAGLAHIHGQGLTHRDIKPSNIFTIGGVVKIGDLGLAKRGRAAVVEGESAEQTVKSNDETASTEVGTYLYTAPEVASGKYSEKADVYSLGVVLFEMFSSFGTGMERVAVLASLRCGGALPAAWADKYPQAANLARAMVSLDPAQRPSCVAIMGDLLIEKLVEKPSYERLEEIVLMQHDQIKDLQQKLKEKEDAIEGMKSLAGK